MIEGWFFQIVVFEGCWVSHNAPLCSPISSFLTNHTCSLFNLRSTKSIPIRSNRFLVFQILPFSSFLTNHNRSLLNLWSTKSIPNRSNSFLVFQIPPISWFLTNHIYSLFNLGSTESIPSRSNSFFSSSLVPISMQCPLLCLLPYLYKEIKWKFWKKRSSCYFSKGGWNKGT